MTHENEPLRHAAILRWLRDYVAAAFRFTQEEPVSVTTDQQAELVAIKCALFARALTVCDGCVLLLANDRQLDFRMHSRGVIEAAMYLIALDRDPAFVTKMKDDDYKSRQARAGLHLSAGLIQSADVKKLLEAFVDQGMQGAKSINASELLKGSQFDRLYRSYRDISGDAAHVSTTSLNRHYVENPVDGSATLIVHPELDDADMAMTFSEMGIAMTISTLLLMKIKEKTNLWDEFHVLLDRYRKIVRASITERENAIGGAP